MSRAIVQSPPPADGRFDRRPLLLPTWIPSLTGLSLSNWDESPSIQISQANGCLLLSARVIAAENMGADEFRVAVIDAYSELFKQLDGLTAAHPVRFWNFLPSIRRDMGSSQDRYMVFNAGRFAAFESRYGGRETFDQQVATASAIGHHHPDLFIHCLSTDHAGRHLGNPRQIAPFRYSEKFGPLPPCFARATIASFNGDPSVLLIGGTASIRGEESLHEDDLPRQFEETIQNLSSLMKSASASGSTACFRELRVYHPRPSDHDWLLGQVRENFPNVTRPQLVRADLCRAELLVEIEGVADLAIS